MDKLLLKVLEQPAVVEWVKQSPRLLLCLIPLSLVLLPDVRAKWLRALEVLITDSYQRHRQRLKQEAANREFARRARDFVDKCLSHSDYTEPLLCFAELVLPQIERRFYPPYQDYPDHVSFYAALMESGLASCPSSGRMWWLNGTDSLRACLLNDPRVQDALRRRVEERERVWSEGAA